MSIPPSISVAWQRLQPFAPGALDFSSMRSAVSCISYLSRLDRYLTRRLTRPVISSPAERRSTFMVRYRQACHSHKILHTIPTSLIPLDQLRAYPFPMISSVDPTSSSSSKKDLICLFAPPCHMHHCEWVTSSRYS